MQEILCTVNENDWKTSYVFTLVTIILSLVVLSFISKNSNMLESFPDFAYPVIIGLLSGFVCGYLSPFQYKKAAFAAALTVIAIGAVPLIIFTQKPNQSQTNDLGEVFLILILFIVVVLLFVLAVFLAVFLVAGAFIGSAVRRRKLNNNRSSGYKKGEKLSK